MPTRRRGARSFGRLRTSCIVPFTRLGKRSTPKKAADTKSVAETETRLGSACEGIDDGAEKDDDSGEIIADGKDKGAVYDHLEGRRRRLFDHRGA